MPIEFRYIEALGCLHTVGRGRVTLEEFLNYHRTVDITDPPSRLLILSDYRETDPSDLSSSDILEHKYQSVKEAIVVSETLAFGLSRMYDGLVYSEKYVLNVFTDIGAAKEWLGLETDALAENRAASPERPAAQTP